jgi:hypothetical protein
MRGDRRRQSMVDEPIPGPQGDYSGTCVVCMRPTDTGLAFQGRAEWAVAGLIVLGLEQDVAVVTLSVSTGSDPGKSPTGSQWFGFRVCSECASRADMEVGLLAREEGIPTYPEPPQ